MDLLTAFVKSINIIPVRLAKEHLEISWIKDMAKAMASNRRSAATRRWFWAFPA